MTLEFNVAKVSFSSVGRMTFVALEILFSYTAFSGCEYLAMLS